jgi:hypothetical protein
MAADSSGFVTILDIVIAPIIADSATMARALRRQVSSSGIVPRRHPRARETRRSLRRECCHHFAQVRSPARQAGGPPIDYLDDPSGGSSLRLLAARYSPSCAPLQPSSSQAGFHCCGTGLGDELILRPEVPMKTAVRKPAAAIRSDSPVPLTPFRRNSAAAVLTIRRRV